MDTSAPETVYFDPQGDITLLVRDHGRDTQMRFVVSSKAMTFACEAWNKMLSPDGHFKEAQSTSTMREISFPDDDAAALAILLNITHLRFWTIPPTLQFNELLAISVLADKYGATNLVRPWVKGWIDPLKDSVDLPGFEEWLWIAWEFGEDDLFAKLAERLTKEVDVDSDGKHVTLKGRVLDPEDGESFFPPDIIESITAVRRQTIVALLDECYKYVHKYRLAYTESTSTTISRHSRNNRECDAITLESLAVALLNMGLNLDGFDVDKVHVRVLDVASWLPAIEMFTYPHIQYQGSNHTDCNFRETLKSTIKEIVSDMPSAVLESHCIHMKRQSEILTSNFLR